MTTLAQQHAATEMTVLMLRLGSDLFAVPIATVEEVLPALPIEHLPQCPPFVRGVVFVRGHLIPVLNAAERLGIQDYQRPDEPHIICFRQEQKLIGVEFDEALDLMSLDLSNSLEIGEIGASDSILQGLVERDGLMIRLLDPDRLISDDEAPALDQLPSTRP